MQHLLNKLHRDFRMRTCHLSSRPPRSLIQTNSLGICPLPQTDPRSFLNSDINTLQPSLKEDGESPSGPVVLCLFSKYMYLIIFISDGRLVFVYIIFLASISEESAVAVSQPKCAVICSAQRANRRSESESEYCWFLESPS